MADPETLQRALGYRFADPSLLDLALAHRSWAFEAGGEPTNERLEFLGDAVLGLVVTDRIFHQSPDSPEGRLAKARAAAVNTLTLAAVARDLGVGAQVRLGRGEEQSGGRDKDSILADTLEAIIGAAYLDAGIDAATALVRRLLDDRLDEILHSSTLFDFKTSLQERVAALQHTLPVYRLSEDGPDHQKQFTAAVYIDDELLGEGIGRSKKEAEQQAAQVALGALSERGAEGEA
ncbi:ribonuclease III [Egibacter rhizosphaerae]|uniref:Ribonuclease 3 n=1 Tax=Egibacter rhizosphaerae TaxID=1670831 RepID=A0A411YCK5_9ACTN|nr:ribonuclease III [Egibacter rhizosphaerae]QBI18983.1 ribonuclease III [Egibacter rhizosphaerae]